jgi:hypothetical protein
LYKPGLTNRYASDSLPGVSGDFDLGIGPGGWLKVTLIGQPMAFVRFERMADRRWAPVWLMQAQPTIAVLRNFPLHRLELAVNASDLIQQRLEERMEESGNITDKDFFASFTGFTIPVPDLPKIKRPEGHKLDDAFYAEVAAVYRAAAGLQMPPRKAVAKAASVSTDVAGRWVHEARKRGYLAPASAGKASAHTPA